MKTKITHYHITVIGKSLHYNPLVKRLQYEHAILLIEENYTSTIRYRNHIKTKDGYLLILMKDKKNIQVTTDYFINLNIEKDRKYAENIFTQRHAS